MPSMTANGSTSTQCAAVRIVSWATQTPVQYACVDPSSGSVWTSATVSSTSSAADVARFGDEGAITVVVHAHTRESERKLRSVRIAVLKMEQSAAGA